MLMVFYVIIWLTGLACCDWSSSVKTSNKLILFLSWNNQQSHTINILLASFAQSVRQVMDPRFFLSCFHGLHTSYLGHKKKEKNSVHNLPYRPHTRLIRGMYVVSSFEHLHVSIATISLRQNLQTVVDSLSNVIPKDQKVFKINVILGCQRVITVYILGVKRSFQSIRSF